MTTTLADADLRARQAASQRGFYRALASGAPGSQYIEVVAGVQATLVPVRTWFSIFNSVFYDDVGALAVALPRLPEVCASAGVRGWSVWVPPGDADARELLQRHGYAEEGTPLLMAAPMPALRLERRRELDLEPSPTWTQVAHCNDAAHEIRAELSTDAAFQQMDDPPSRLYAARVGDEIAAALVARHFDGDCYFWFVATRPEFQRQGLAGELMREALRDAASAGCTTASLESTSAGEPVYRDLGFTDLGRFGRFAAYAS